MNRFKLLSSSGSQISESGLLLVGPAGTFSVPFSVGLPLKNRLADPTISRFLPTSASFTPFLSQLRSTQIGVEVGYYARLHLNGVGFRVWNVGRFLLLDLGFSTFFLYTLPKSVFSVLAKKSSLLLFSPSLPLLQTVVAQLRRLRPVDLYKGKGVRIFNDSIVLKKRKKDGK